MPRSPEEQPSLPRARADPQDKSHTALMVQHSVRSLPQSNSFIFSQRLQGKSYQGRPDAGGSPWVMAGTAVWILAR